MWGGYQNLAENAGKGGKPRHSYELGTLAWQSHWFNYVKGMVDIEIAAGKEQPVQELMKEIKAKGEAGKGQYVPYLS